MIHDVLVQPLRKIVDARGRVMHMMKSTDPHFEKFGEIYFSTAYPGIIKGWHVHSLMTINYAVVKGTIQLVLYDQRPDSSTRGEVQEIIMGDHNYVLVRVPPGVVNGFRVIGTEEAIVANCASIPHDPTEIVRIDPFSPEIPYQWKAPHG
ncbi:dTDP-4-dehydrorhamnose 3,5-epimerase [Candidatus Uhrbacteria bacterium RIFCSPHIGHO2_12_FULL_57_11]|uniref:dTDP-4-dehydrorhamnose 3,5-epimerase n=2 Tax=Candidatus Uhriibacteriota TaxID=1752732 RepID=A0A1F7UN41_9BACT|nr:MAG: dTDP-4-dehydrorhamnose 3,5-epimerase [Candidatus Uhrbacteria bacterium RIFCSPHIGHO2_02_FULL_57_19]OGL79703.1 MAG: dTDP-4-dehydrorhamnose 3,5-epimerase [Candidatus Uhrbacteria bacterium RIFCSPHIGHO2_12_FULL_57_11]